jgi:hypothetical protein
MAPPLLTTRVPGWGIASYYIPSPPDKSAASLFTFKPVRTPFPNLSPQQRCISPSQPWSPSSPSSSRPQPKVPRGLARRPVTGIVASRPAGGRRRATPPLRCRPATRTTAPSTTAGAQSPGATTAATPSCARARAPGPSTRLTRMAGRRSTSRDRMRRAGAALVTS